MRIKIRYFASVREMIGLSEEEMAVLPGSTIGSLMGMVRSCHESLSHFKDMLIAVNGEYVGVEHELGEGDVVALFPRVSGG